MPLHSVHSMVPFPTHDPPSLRYLRDQMLSTSPPHALERPSYLATAMSEQGDLPSALGRSSSEPWRAPSTHPVRWTPPAAPRIPSTFQRLQQELWVCRDALQSPSPFIFTQGCQQFSRLLRRTLQSYVPRFLFWAPRAKREDLIEEGMDTERMNMCSMRHWWLCSIDWNEQNIPQTWARSAVYLKPRCVIVVRPVGVPLIVK